MASILEKVNSNLQGKLDAKKVRVVTKEDVLAKYKELKTKNEVIELQFTGADVSDEDAKGGMFTKVESGVLLVLPFSNMNEPEINRYRAAGLLNVKFKLHVASVDESKGEVVFRFTNDKDRRRTLREACIAEINSRIAKKEFPRVSGRVVRVNPYGAYVNILDQNIMGRISRTKWQPCFTRFLTGKCKVGEYYEFVVTSRIERAADTDSTPTYQLSRVDIAENPWDNLNTTGLKTGSALLVTCCDKPEGKTYWWGSSDRVPGIEILADYTEKFPEKNIFADITYMCKVRLFSVNKDDPKKNRFSVTPFDVADEDRVKYSAMLNARKKVAKEPLEEVVEADVPVESPRENDAKDEG